VKGHLLYWGDSPTISTGFGVVARHVLAALFDAGYEIDCLGINSLPEFPERSQFPYPIAAASVPGYDPLGYRALARALLARPYDVLLVQNDVQVTHAAATHLATMRDRGTALPPVVCYYPVDCTVRADLTGMLASAEAIVTCTEHGRRETAKAVIGGRSPLVIPHGVDTRAFKPLPPEERQAVRQRFRRASQLEPDTLIVCSVAANSIRKDLARTIAAFARFTETLAVPAVLYLHTVPVDNGLDLTQAALASGLLAGHDVLFPQGHHATRGISDATLNEIYNASDLYFTTTLGEGWGLPITEAMAAGLPVVGPRHSSLEELGAEGRAILYECREKIWVDNSGFRPLGLMDDIVAALVQAASLSEIDRRRMVERAREFAVGLDWSVVAPRWSPVIDAVVAARAAQTPAPEAMSSGRAMREEG
jgi:glycosyltransferase involved in cell wall biosynthesis